MISLSDYLKKNRMIEEFENFYNKLDEQEKQFLLGHIFETNVERIDEGVKTGNIGKGNSNKFYSSMDEKPDRCPFCNKKL